jgi:hypothetical protein
MINTDECNVPASAHWQPPTSEGPTCWLMGSEFDLARYLKCIGPGGNTRVNVSVHYDDTIVAGSAMFRQVGVGVQVRERSSGSYLRAVYGRDTQTGAPGWGPRSYRTDSARASARHEHGVVVLGLPHADSVLPDFPLFFP